MCYAIPAQVKSMDGDVATVDYGGVMKTVNMHLVDDINIGDYVLIHAGFAIEKLDKESAEESLRILRNYMEEAEKGLGQGQDRKDHE